MPVSRTRPRKTVEDYSQLPEGVRAELIDGEFYLLSSPDFEHQRAIKNIFLSLHPFISARSLGELVLSPMDVFLPSGDVVQPDLIFVARKNLHIIRDRIRGVPDLQIEAVSSTGAERDRLVKRGLYARNRVPEYWLADTANHSVEVLELTGADYAIHGYFEQGESLTSPLLAGLELPVKAIFAA